LRRERERDRACGKDIERECRSSSSIGEQLVRKWPENVDPVTNARQPRFIIQPENVSPSRRSRKCSERARERERTSHVPAVHLCVRFVESSSLQRTSLSTPNAGRGFVGAGDAAAIRHMQVSRVRSDSIPRVSVSPCVASETENFPLYGALHRTHTSALFLPAHLRKHARAHAYTHTRITRPRTRASRLSWSLVRARAPRPPPPPPQPGAPSSSRRLEIRGLTYKLGGGQARVPC
jgi:hypothetical protein